MKRFFSLFVVTMIVLGATYFLFQQDFFKNMKLPEEQVKPLELSGKNANQKEKDILPLLKGDVFTWIGKESQLIADEFGDPAYKNLTPYGYTWWVYTDGETNYIQFGIRGKQVETIFATGGDISVEPFQIGESYDTLADRFPIEDKITYQKGPSFFSFKLNEDDQKLQPLFKLSDNLFVQCYIDTFTNELSSIRLLTGDLMLKQRLYEMEYRGELPEEENMSEDDWAKITKGMEKQIFDLTNVYRTRHDVPILQEDEQVQEVAYLHSKDMEENHYFSHYSEDGKGLKERLAENDVYYLSAGENIAAQYTDGPAAIEGWLNSESHREALLYEDYTHLGVGVFGLYYTQNFLLKP